MSGQTYEGAGVRGQGDALSAVVKHLGPTLTHPAAAETVTRFGDYASVLKLSDDLALAISTDGVGTKTIVASRLARYDTIGFDCVAMNVNDVICVGADPIAMVDYLGVNRLDATRTEAILRGLADAADEAGIAIPGGELAQLPEVIGSDGTGDGDETAFDLVGTCVGVLHPNEVILGQEMEPGHSIIGLTSSGIHSNGLTLARRVLLDRAGLSLDDHHPALGRTIGEELLEPTRIYARATRALIEAGIRPSGLAHITSDGLTNLCRLRAAVGFRFTSLPPVPAIFRLIQDEGAVPDEEMFRVFNMGVGFVAVVDGSLEERAVGTLRDAGYEASALGEVTGAAGLVEIEPIGLAGSLEEGESAFRRV